QRSPDAPRCAARGGGRHGEHGGVEDAAGRAGGARATPRTPACGGPGVTRLSMRFDLRIAPGAGTTFAGQHRAMLEMVSWADAIGLDAICLSEHHGDPAGYSSAPLTLAAAVLGRTRHVAVSIAAALVPLHDPVRFAEQVTTLDCLAPGRLSLVLGAGY